MKYKVLIIDDEESVGYSIKRILENDGDIDSEIAMSGKKGIEMYNLNQYDIVISDLIMGEINGLEVLKQINNFKPDILLVAYGMKKQEFWINDNLEKLDVGLVMGVGRSFDYYSGDLKRAPEGLRKMGMEWFYSLVKEPKRFKRQLVLPKFIWKVLREK